MKFVLSVMCLAASIATAQTSVDVGLVARYRFEGNCLDASGLGHDGSAIGITYTRGPAGAGSSAAYFDGTSSEVQIQGVPVPTNNAFSWALWIRCDDVPPLLALIERCIAIGNNQTTPALFVQSGARLTFGSFSFSSGGAEVGTGTSLVKPHEWLHVVCTSDTAGTRRIYIDGVLAAEGTSVEYGQPLERILLGRDRLDSTPRLRGAMDDLRFYSRPLTQSEVTTLFSMGDCNGDGLIDLNQILRGDLPDVDDNGIPDGPPITSQPSDQSVGVDSSVTFVVEVSPPASCSATVAYQWQRRNAAVGDPTAPSAWINLVDGAGFAGTHASNLSIIHPTPALATGYRCRINGGCACDPNGFVYTNAVNFSISCPADFNADGGIDFSDVEAFFERWENGC